MKTRKEEGTSEERSGKKRRRSRKHKRILKDLNPKKRTVMGGKLEIKAASA